MNGFNVYIVSILWGWQVWINPSSVTYNFSASLVCLLYLFFEHYRYEWVQCVYCIYSWRMTGMNKSCKCLLPLLSCLWINPASISYHYSPACCHLSRVSIERCCLGLSPDADTLNYRQKPKWDYHQQSLHAFSALSSMYSQSPDTANLRNPSNAKANFTKHKDATITI